MWSHVCVCVCVWGGGFACGIAIMYSCPNVCMRAFVCARMHAFTCVCMHACVYVCAGAGLRAQVEDVMHEARQARERAEVAARRSGATTGVYWFACVRASVLFICVPVHQHACTRMFARMYTYHMHRL